MYSTYRKTPAVVHYVAGPCGSGKTHAFIDLTADKHTCARNERNTLYVGISKELLDQVEMGLKAGGITARTHQFGHPSGSSDT